MPNQKLAGQEFSFGERLVFLRFLLSYARKLCGNSHLRRFHVDVLRAAGTWQ